MSASGKPNGKTKPELSLGDMIIYLLIAVLVMLYFLLLAALVVALAPGMLVVAAIKSVLHLSLDVAQCWTFAILVSAGFLLLLFRRYRDWTTAAAGYLVLSGTIIVVSTVAYYGFKASYPRALLAAYFPSVSGQAEPDAEPTTARQSQSAQQKLRKPIEPDVAQQQAEPARRGSEPVETQRALADAEADKRRAEQEGADLTAKRVAEERRKQVEVEAAELRRQTAENLGAAKRAEIARAKHVIVKGPLQYCADLTGSDRHLSAGTRSLLSVRVGPYDSHVPDRNDEFVVVRQQDFVELTGAKNLEDLCGDRVLDHPVITVDAWECGEEAEVRALPEEFRSTGARRVRHRVPCAASIEVETQYTAEERPKQAEAEASGSSHITFIVPSHRKPLSDQNKTALEKLKEKQEEQRKAEEKRSTPPDH